MSKICAKACKVALTLTLLLSFARANAQTVTVSGSCPTGPGNSFVYVHWSAPTTDPPQVQLWEYYYGRYGSGSLPVGSGYSGETTEIELSTGTYYEFELYDGDTQTSGGPNGRVIAGESMNCVGNESLDTGAFAPIGRMSNWSVFDPLTYLQPRAESNSGSGNLARSRALHSVTSSAPLVIGPGYFEDDEAATFGSLLPSLAW